MQKYLGTLNQIPAQMDVPYLEQLKIQGYNNVYPARRSPVLIRPYQM